MQVAAKGSKQADLNCPNGLSHRRLELSIVSTVVRSKFKGELRHVMGRLRYTTSASSIWLFVAYLHNLLSLLQEVTKRSSFFTFFSDCRNNQRIINVKQACRRIYTSSLQVHVQFKPFKIIDGQKITPDFKGRLPMQKMTCSAFPGNWTRDFGVASTSYRVKLF